MANTKVTGDVIANGTISTVHLADDAITAAKLDSTATGITFADLTVDTNTLYVDATNNRVGIGTTVPSVLFDARLSGTTGKITEFHNSVGYGIGFTVESDGGVNTINSESNQALAFATNGASNERMRIDSSGNIGVGVTPESWGTNGDTRAIQISTMTSLSEAFDGTQLASNFYFDGTNDKYIQSDFATSYLQIDGTHRWRYAASGTANANITWSEAMRITPSGNISIDRTTNYVGGAPSGTDGRFNVYTDVGSSTWTQQIRHDSTTGNGLFIRAGASSSYYTAYFAGYDESNVHFVVRGDGNVGIGTDSPGETLHLKLTTGDPRIKLETGGGGDPGIIFQSANNRTGEMFFQDGSTSARFSYDHAAEAFKMYAHNQTVVDFYVSETLAYLPSQSFGIGATSPQYNLHVVDASNTSYVGISNQGTANADRQLRLGFGNGHTYATIQGTRLNVADDVDIVLQGGGGNVGIGTTSPIGKTDIFVGASGYTNNVTTLPVGTWSFANGSGGSSYPTLVSKSNATGAGMTLLAATDDGAPNGMDFNIRKGDNTDFSTLTTSGFTFSRFGTVLMTILRNGNVGIGTTSPTTELHITASKAGNVGISVQNTNSSYSSQIRFLNSVGTEKSALTFVPSDTSLRFFHNGSDRMLIDSSGNVGIGTNLPGSKLHIKDASNRNEATSQFRIEGSGYSAFQWLDGSGYYIGQNSNFRSLRIYSGSNEAAGVQLSAGGTSWGSFSDERLKENIEDLGLVSDKIKDIRCITYNRSDIEDSKKTIGFIAQDFVGKFDEVLDKSKIKEDGEEYYSIKYTETIPILLKAIQEQQEIINDLKAEIETLKLQINN